MRKNRQWLIGFVLVSACRWISGSPQPAERVEGSFREPMKDCAGKSPSKVVVECNAVGNECSCKDLLGQDGGAFNVADGSR